MNTSFLMINLFMLNGNNPMIIVDEYDSMKTCQMAQMEMSRMQMPHNEKYAGYCTTVIGLDIKPSDMSKFDGYVSQIRSGESSLPVLGINLETRKYEKFTSLKACFENYQVCGYSFQEFSYLVPVKK